MKPSRTVLGWPDPGWAVITGASSGIGEEFARRLAGQGFSVLLAARRQDRLDELAQSLRGSCGVAAEVLAVDLSRDEGIRRLTDRIVSIADLDILISNAGSSTVGPFATSEPDVQAALVRLQTEAPVRLARAAIPRMKTRRRGLLVFTSSLSAFMAAPGSGVYIPAKAFLAALARVLAPELKDAGIMVQALCPSYTRTGFHDDPSFDGLKAFLPRWAWGTSRAVVDASLRGASAGRTVVVPGLLNRLTLRFVPKTIMLRAYMKRRWAEVSRSGPQEPAP
jgi:uncharacterized protein